MNIKNRKQWKSKAQDLINGLDPDATQVALIQMLIPLGLKAVQEMLEQGVRDLAGPRYSRKETENYRWGKNRGWIYLGDQKVNVTVPRVRSLTTKKEVGLSHYTEFQNPRILDYQLLNRVLYGMSQRRYRDATIGTMETFGISPSSVSRRFIRASAKKLEQLHKRRLDAHKIVAIIVDGKRFGEMDMIVALGITIFGDKVILGFVESGTENQVVVESFLRELLERGLTIGEGVLCILDGAKGLHKGIKNVFGDRAQIQRCQQHKVENVRSYLPKKHQETICREIRDAYNSEEYGDAKSRLKVIVKKLKLMNESAANSLEEGLEETLTLHRLGLFKELGTSLRTTNCIESLFSQVGQYTDRVDYWKNSQQRQRWLASSLLEIEPRLRKIRGFKNLPQLRQALKGQSLQTQRLCA